MFEALNNLPELYQGIVYIFAGLTIVLYALGFVQKGITVIIVLFALYLILVGCVKTGLYKKIMLQIDHKRRK